MKKKLIFIGPQGSGKGTQAKIIAKKLGIAHISTGDMFRNVKGKLKEKVDKCINEGKLMPDDLTLEILKKRLEKSDCKSGFILDGYPRNLEQAKDLEKVTKIDEVIEIRISDKTAVHRLGGRWNCNKCGIAYNILTEPKPKKDKICNKCGGRLVQRKDDKFSAIKKRLEIYHEDTEPILNYYKEKLIRIDGEQNIKKVTEEILKKIKY